MAAALVVGEVSSSRLLRPNCSVADGKQWANKVVVGIQSSIVLSKDTSVVHSWAQTQSLNVLKEKVCSVNS